MNFAMVTTFLLTLGPATALAQCAGNLGVARGESGLKTLIDRPIVQFAGIKDARDAERVLAAGADWLGFPLRLDVHLPDLSEDAAAELIAGFEPHVKPVLITYLSDAAEIAQFLATLNTRFIQLHGPIATGELRKLRRLRPNVFIIKSLVIGARSERKLRDDVDQLADLVDAFITDTFDPTTGASGATGKLHDWRVSRALIERSPKPVILAGGLNPRNVREAILATNPAGVDVHTGVEDAAGDKDARLVAEFVNNARDALEEVRARREADNLRF